MNTYFLRRLVAIPFLLVPCLLAQSMTVAPETTLTVGGTASVTYDDAAQAGKKVTITFTGKAPGQVQSIEITLDGAGHGATEWTVPNWEHVTVTAPQVGAAERDIE